MKNDLKDLVMDAYVRGADLHHKDSADISLVIANTCYISTEEVTEYLFAHGFRLSYSSEDEKLVWIGEE